MKTIAILDSNETQRNRMASTLTDWFKDLNENNWFNNISVLTFEESKTFVNWLESNGQTTAVVSLAIQCLSSNQEECELIPFMKTLETNFPIVVHCEDESPEEQRDFGFNKLGWDIGRIINRDEEPFYCWISTILQKLSYNSDKLTVEEVLRLYSNGHRLFAGLEIEESREEDFRNTILDDACFAETLLSSDFRGASLQRTCFKNAYIKASDFRDADLRQSDFRGAALCGTTFLGSNLEGARFEGSSYHSTTFTEKDFKPDW